MTESVNIRALALECLMEINENGKYIHHILRAVLDKYQYLEKQERAFLNRLVEGTLERQIELDYVLNAFSKVRVAKMKPLIRSLLRMSLYQLMYMDAVPDSAVCNEAVKLAKKRGFGQLSGFVNGLLRNIARNREEVAYPDRKSDPSAYLSVRYSMPEWIVLKWIHTYGIEKTENILKAFYQDYPLAVRTNQTRISTEKLKKQLLDEGAGYAEPIPKYGNWMDKAHPSLVSAYERISKYALLLSGIDYLGDFPSFQRGEFYIQDVSSMLAAETAEPKKGDYCIDVCAAPGGKSTHLAELLDGTGMVEARDLTEYKVGLMEENRIRQGLVNLKSVCMDASCFDEASVGNADILICDLPCSGLGVLGKKPDIRYKMTEDLQEELVELQRKILSTVYPYLKVGGTLIYSTCTINQSENEENVKWLLETHPMLSLEFMQQLFPQEAGSDGFFLAKLKKVKI